MKETAADGRPEPNMPTSLHRRGRHRSKSVCEHTRSVDHFDFFAKTICAHWGLPVTPPNTVSEQMRR
eukprot:6871189-Pyramimonas_sp.AAC.1